MRLFLAIMLDNGIKDELYCVQKQLQLQGVKGNYIPRENMHLTLAFIGEYKDPGHVSDVISQIELEPVRIIVDGFGSFNDIFWLGIREDEGLATNVKRIRKALSDNGIPFDRKKFTPHMTIVRKFSCNKGFPTVPPFPAAMDVRYISLMRSERGRGGMIYTEIDAFEVREEN